MNTPDAPHPKPLPAGEREPSVTEAREGARPPRTRYVTRDGVAVITLDNPPVNGLSHETRTGIVEGLDRALADPGIGSIVLTGAGKLFSGGADIREFNTPKALAEPTLHTVIRAVEESPKPVIAAIGGTRVTSASRPHRRRSRCPR